MAKSKVAKASKAEEPKAITSVKGSNVTKSAQTPKSKSKEVAKAVAAKAGKSSKKSKKEETPVSSSESDEAETSDSSDSSESDSDAEVPAPKANGAAKVNGKANGANGAKAKAKDDSDDSSEEDSDESSEDEKPAAKAASKAAPKGKGAAAKKAESDSDSDEEGDSSDGSSDSGHEADAKVVKPNGKAAETKKKDSSDEEEDSDESSGSDSSDSEVEAEAPPSKKRKAETESTPVAKKAKADPETPATPSNASKNLFVGNLSWNVDEEWLKSEFESYGSITGVRIVTDRATGRSKGFGYVEYESLDDAVKAYDAMKEAGIDNRPINLDYSKPRQEGDRNQRDSGRANKYGDQVGEPTATLFVGNISFDATSDMVGELFGQHGDVTGVRLPTDPNSGAPKGFGYVEFSSVDDAKTAIAALKGAELAGRAMRLDYSQPRGDSGGSPRGGRGRGRGDRGSFGGRGDRGGRGRGGGDRGGRGGRGGFSTNRGGFGDFKGKKMTF